MLPVSIINAQQQYYSPRHYKRHNDYDQQQGHDNYYDNAQNDHSIAQRYQQPQTAYSKPRIRRYDQSQELYNSNNDNNNVDDEPQTLVSYPPSMASKFTQAKPQHTNEVPSELISEVSTSNNEENAYSLVNNNNSNDEVYDFTEKKTAPPPSPTQAPKRRTKNSAPTQKPKRRAKSSAPAQRPRTARTTANNLAAPDTAQAPTNQQYLQDSTSSSSNNAALITAATSNSTSAVTNATAEAQLCSPMCFLFIALGLMLVLVIVICVSVSAIIVISRFAKRATRSKSKPRVRWLIDSCHVFFISVLLTSSPYLNPSLTTY